MIRLVLSDMDGTLLHNDKSLPKEIESIFEKLGDQGIACGAATGRSLVSLLRDFPNFKDKATFISDNGAIVYHKGKVIYESMLPEDWVKGIIQEVKEIESLHIILCTNKNAYALNRSKFHDKNLKQYYPFIDYEEDLLPLTLDNVIKVSIYDDLGAEVNAFPLLKHFNNRMNVVVSAKEWLDFTMPGINKGKALEILQDELNISKDESLAFGDYFNDLDMLKKVKYSYAMENAVDEVKAISNYVCPSNENEGVVATLKELFKI